LRALEESNHPVGIFLEYNRQRPFAIHAVNDLLEDLGDAEAFWSIMSGSGEEVSKGRAAVTLGPDSHVRVADLDFRPQEGTAYHILLSLRSRDGRELARNIYRNPFQPQPHPEGHPNRMDHEIGMRLWWAAGK
jgi:beta-mannosidase